MRTVLVCGGRTYADRFRLAAVLDGLHRTTPIELLVHGDAAGADRLAAGWAADRGIGALAVPAEWERYGRAAGPIRNREMLANWRPDTVVAFPGGKGTADMIRRAKAAGVRLVIEVET